MGRALLNAFRVIEAANPKRLSGAFGNASWTDKAQLPDETLKNLIESQVGQGSTFSFTLPIRLDERGASDQGGGEPPRP